MTDQPSWHDDTPATDEQIDTIRRDLDGGATISQQAAGKLLAAYDEVRLDRAVLAATNRALEARAKKGETELDEVRARLGREQIQWGVRYTAGVDGTGADCSEEEDPVDYCDDQIDATRLAAQTPGAIPVWHLRGEWKEPTS